MRPSLLAVRMRELRRRVAFPGQRLPRYQTRQRAASADDSRTSDAPSASARRSRRGATSARFRSTLAHRKRGLDGSEVVPAGTRLRPNISARWRNESARRWRKWRSPGSPRRARLSATHRCPASRRPSPPWPWGNPVGQERRFRSRQGRRGSSASWIPLPPRGGGPRTAIPAAAWQLKSHGRHSSRRRRGRRRRLLQLPRVWARIGPAGQD